MTLTIEIDAEMESALRKRADSEHTDPQSLVTKIVRRELAGAANDNDAVDPAEIMARFEASQRLVRELNRGIKMPVLPDSAYTSESYYQDHD